jgi:hypothetical protein
MKLRFTLPLLLSVLLTATGVKAQTADPTQQIQEFNITINDLGDAKYEMSEKMTQTQWEYFKQSPIVNDPSIARRNLQRGMASADIEDFKRDIDDMNRVVKMSLTVKAFATYKGDGKWEMRLDSKDPQITKLADNAFMSISNVMINGQLTQQIYKVYFPSRAYNILQSTDSFDKAMFTYEDGGGLMSMISWNNMLAIVLILVAGALILVNVQKPRASFNPVLATRAAMVILLAFGVRSASAQDISMRGDTLITSSGSKFWINEEITLGNGSAGDKTFEYVYEPGMRRHKNLSQLFEGRKAIIRKFAKDGNYKKSYSYNILILDFGDKHKYYCDLPGALAHDELHDPGAVVADADGTEAKLARLKKAYDSGAITKEEYETLKSKVTASTTPAKDTKKPAQTTVF